MVTPFGPLYQCDCFYSIGVTAAKYRLHVQDKSGNQELWRLARNLRDNFIGRIAQHLSVDVSFYGIYVLRKYPPDPPLDHFEPIGTVGAVNSPTVHHALKAVVSLRTGLLGRSMRGRKFLGGMPQSYVDGRRLNQAGKLAVDLEWGLINEVYRPDNLINDITWGILHRYVGGALIEPLPFNFTPFIQAVPRWRLSGFKKRPIVLPFP